METAKLNVSNEFQSVKIRSLISHYEAAEPPRIITPPPGIGKLPTKDNTLLMKYIEQVNAACRNHTIFTVAYTHSSVARALRRRGWLEKLRSNQHSKLQNLSMNKLLPLAQPGNCYETVIISRIIHRKPAFFIWVDTRWRNPNIDESAYRNRIKRSPNLNYTSKVGMLGCVEQAHWNRAEGLSDLKVPRSYRMMGDSQERMEFIEDFRRTQCRSFIKYVVDNIHSGQHEEIIDEDEGTLKQRLLKFAINDLKFQLLDIENMLLEEHQNPKSAVEWQNFINNSTLVIEKRAKIKISLEDMKDYVRTASAMLRSIEHKRPDYKLDGYRNLWILKPAMSAEGIGIKINNTLDDILLFTKNRPKHSYIAQKYIERPLIIYKTKFDIRAYLLLTVTEKMLRIYIYKDCYLRFSSRLYTLNDLGKNVHLTNHAVQKHYSKDSRDSRIPSSLMWSLEQFQTYLKHSDAPPNIWEDVIYAGFRDNLVAVVLSAVEGMNLIKNTFELDGCDFMLDENYNPYLIELNSCPDLSRSTHVTARICPRVQEDVVKVVVDLPNNPKGSTGQFQLVHELNYKNELDGIPLNSMNILGRSKDILQLNQVGRRQFGLKQNSSSTGISDDSKTDLKIERSKEQRHIKV